MIGFLFGRHLPEQRRRNYGENSLPSLLIIERWTWVPVTNVFEIGQIIDLFYITL